MKSLRTAHLTAFLCTALLAIGAGCSNEPTSSTGGTGAGGSGTSTASNGGAGGASGGVCGNASGSHVWSVRFGGTGNQGAANQTAGVSLDANGNILLGCRFEGELTFADNLKFMAPSGGSDGCVAKLDPNGGPMWAKGFGATQVSSNYGRSGGGPVADAQGSIYVSTNFQGTVDLGGGPLSSVGGYDIAMARLTGDGGHVWSHVYGGQGHQQNIPLVVSGDGVFAAGTFENDLEFLLSAGSFDAWAARLVSDGNWDWMKQYGDAPIQGIYSAVAAPDGGVVLAGGFEGTIDFDGVPLVSAGGFDAFVAKLDSTGAPQWSRRFGDAASIVQISVGAGLSGDVIVVLGTDQVVDFGGGPLDVVNGIDIVVAKLDSSGTHIWSKRFGGQGDQLPLAGEVDSKGCIAVGADVTGTIDFGGGPLSSDDSDVVVVKLDPEGNHIWSKQFASAGPQHVSTLAIDANDDIVLAGGFEGTLDFGGGPLQSSGGEDIFVAKLGR